VTSLPIDWYAARAAGVVAYVLLTAVVLVGLTLAGRVQLPRWPKFAVTDVHRFGSLLVAVFLALHILTVGLDTYTRFSLTQLLVPFTSSYRPLWVALGIVTNPTGMWLSVSLAGLGTFWSRRSQPPHSVHPIGGNLDVWPVAIRSGTSSAPMATPRDYDRAGGMAHPRRLRRDATPAPPMMR